MGNSPGIDRKWGFSLVCLFLTYLFILYSGRGGSSLMQAGFLLVVASGRYSLLECAGFLLQWLLLLQSMGSRVLGLQQLWCLGSKVVALGFGWSSACGILPDQELNQCPQHCKEDSQPLDHQGSLEVFLKAT